MILYSLFSYIYIAIQWCWNVSIFRRSVQELWMYRSDILCCFWHPVTFSSPSLGLNKRWSKAAPARAERPGRAAQPRAPRCLRRAAGPGLGGSGQQQQRPLRRAQVTHKPRAGSVYRVITRISFSLLYCDAGNFFPPSYLKFRAHSKVELIISWL